MHNYRYYTLWNLNRLRVRLYTVNIIAIIVSSMSGNNYSYI